MGYVLPLIPQMDGSPHAGGNCGCVATAHALRWSTDGAVHPTPNQVRKALDGRWAGKSMKPPSDATSLADQGRAWETFRANARGKGWKLPRFDVRLMAPWSDVIAALDAGNAVVLQIDNATLNARAPRLSGFPTFNGFHVITLTAIRRRSGTVELLDHDGGFDGRNRSVPRGPQWVKGWILREAAQEKVRKALVAGGMAPAKALRQSDDVAVFAVIAKAARIVKPAPPPDPVPPSETPEQTIARLTKGLTDSAALLVAAMERQAALEGLLGRARSALLAVSAAGNDAEAALDELDTLLPPPPDTGATATDGVGPEP